MKAENGSVLRRGLANDRMGKLLRRRPTNDRVGHCPEERTHHYQREEVSQGEDPPIRGR
jgi:hypothetical protein